MIVFIAFWILMGLTAVNPQRLAAIRSKAWEDWVLDATGLLFQGLIIPILQITVVYQLYGFLLPGFHGCLNLPTIVAFILSFVFVDYLYYWNHRFLHSRWLWHLHKVHHTMTDRDVLGTSRNTLWTSFFIVYLWIHPLFIYLLVEPNWYIVGASLTSALDLWRHSEIEPTPGNFLHRLLSPWLILPCNHAWHHSNNSTIGNFGANLKLWGKIHGTDYTVNNLPKLLGIESKLSFYQKLMFPFRFESSHLQKLTGIKSQ